jgi:hypothetical protein
MFQKNVKKLIFYRELLVIVEIQVGEYTIEDEKQYARIGVAYKWAMPLGFSGYYGFYGGGRYDWAYYNLGSQVKIRWDLIDNFLDVGGTFEPFYDSKLDSFLGYDFFSASFSY